MKAPMFKKSFVLELKYNADGKLLNTACQIGQFDDEKAPFVLEKYTQEQLYLAHAQALKVDTVGNINELRLLFGFSDGSTLKFIIKPTY